MIIVGGGYIAAEFAHVFDALGVEVTVATRGPALLREQDETGHRAVHRDRAGTLHGPPRRRTDRPPSSASDGTIVLTCPAATTIEGDALLVATGRVPNGDRHGRREDRPRAHRRRAHPGRRVPAHRRSRASGRSATSARPTSSSTSPTTRRGSCSTTCCTPTRCAPPSHRFVPSAVFTHPQVAVGRAARAGPPRAGHALRRQGPGLRRRRVRLGDGGHHRVREGPRRARRHAARRPLHGPAGLLADPARWCRPWCSGRRPRRSPRASTGSTRHCPSSSRTRCWACRSITEPGCGTPLARPLDPTNGSLVTFISDERAVRGFAGYSVRRNRTTASPSSSTEKAIVSTISSHVGTRNDPH